MEDFYIELNDSSNIQELVDLAKTNYDSGDIINKNYINWQYNENPLGKAFITVARATKNNELVGQYIVIPQEYLINNKIEKGTLSLNTLTREDFRGRGLFTKMALQTYDECANKNHNFTVGFPNQQSYPGFIKKLGFKYLGNIQLLIKPLNPIKIFLNKIKKQEKHGGEIQLNFKKYSSSNINIDLFSINNDKEKYLSFWQEYSTQNIIQLNKSIEYLKWRYIDIPTRNYSIVKLEKNNKIIGLVIIRVENTLGNKTALLMDVMLINNAKFYNDNNVFLEYLTKTLRQNKIELIACLISENSYENNILKKNKFIKVPQKILPQPIPYILRIHKEFEGSANINKLDNWHLCFGDYDIF